MLRQIAKWLKRQPAPLRQEPQTSYFLFTIHGGDPGLLGPYPTAEQRDNAAADVLKGWPDGFVQIFPLGIVHAKGSRLVTWCGRYFPGELVMMGYSMTSPQIQAKWEGSDDLDRTRDLFVELTFNSDLD